MAETGATAPVDSTQPTNALKYVLYCSVQAGLTAAASQRLGRTVGTRRDALPTSASGKRVAELPFPAGLREHRLPVPAGSAGGKKAQRPTLPEDPRRAVSGVALGREPSYMRLDTRPELER